MRTELEVARRSPDVDWDATSGLVIEELDRLQRLVDDLLLLARGDERPYASTPFSIADVVRDVGARARRVPVDVVLADGDGTVVGDEAAVGRALDHLVVNAARHARRAVRVTAAGDADEIAIHVDDDGRGIPPARRAEVVRRFVRLDGARARDRGGAGLGLAVTSDVATAHGGRLVIADGPLGGARVTMTLPRDRAGGSGGGIGELLAQQPLEGLPGGVARDLVDEHGTGRALVPGELALGEGHDI
jgi:signal transduction histidine kinase